MKQQRLNQQQKERLRAKMRTLAAAGVLRVGDTNHEWENGEYISGSREDVLHRGINRPCGHCGEPVFTSRRYPEDTPLICDVCAAAVLLKEDAAA